MHKRRHRNMRVFDFVFNFVRPHREGDITDRINYFVTSFILLSMAATLGARLYLSPTINCYLPAETTKNQEEYIEQMCFAKNTYYVPHEKSVPERERERNEVRYPIYQWSPFILCIQAVLFYAPRWLWKLFSSLSGLLNRLSFITSLVLI